MATNNRDLFRDYITQTLEGGQLTSPVLWDFVKYVVRAFLCGLKRQTFLTIITLCGVVSSPWMVSNFAAGFATRQVNYQQPAPGIIAGQVGSFARTVSNVAGQVGGSTIQYISDTQMAPTNTQIKSSQIVHQYQQTPTILGTGMGQY